MLDLTKVKATLNNVKRNIYYPKGVTLKFVETGNVLLEVKDGWFFSTSPRSSFTEGSEYFELSVADKTGKIDYEEIIPRANRILIGESEYIIKDYQRPKGATKAWYVRIESNIRHF